MALQLAVAEYSFDFWTTGSGLPHNTVDRLLQSRDGYLWLGTPDGLARFDGVRFTVFNKANSPGFPNNRVTALYQAPDDALWIGLGDGQLARYQQGSFTSFGVAHGLPAAAVLSVSGDQDGNLWVYSQNATLWRWQDGRFRPGLPESVAPLFAGPNIGWNRAGCIWVTTADALHIFSRGKLTTLGRSNGLPSLHISRVIEDQHGTWWLATEDAGLVEFREGKVVRRFTRQDGLPRDCVFLDRDGLHHPVVCKDRAGSLWMSGVGPWLGRLKDGVLFAFPSTNAPPLAALAQTGDDAINALLEDAEGNLWVGTSRNGLIRAREQVVNVISTQQGLQAASIYPVCEDHTGAVWLGAWVSGLARVAGGRVTTFPFSGADRLVTALYEDRAGQLWVGTHGGVGIFQYGMLTNAGVPTGLTNGAVLAICQDHSGAFWFAAEHALCRYQDGQLSRFTERDGLATGHYCVMIEDRAGALWIGSGGGLTRWANGRFTTWTEREGLPSNHVRALYEDGDGTLWIGSADGGLARFKAGKFTRYTTKNGLFDDGVFQILEDARGNFWMSSNRGIHRVNKRELNEFAEGRRHKITSRAYGKNDGMLDAECNGGRWPAGVQTRDGKLWFPTMNGVAVIDPAALPTDPRPPPTLIEEVVLDREPLPLVAAAPQGAADAGAQNSDALTRRRHRGDSYTPLRIPPGKANLEIRYTGLNLRNSEWISFKYQLAGVDDNWVEVGRRRTAYYSHVPPGHYTFTVVAANSDGVWNDTGASLSFVFLPAWYQAWWFRVTGAGVLAGLVFAAYRQRVARLEQARALQQEFSRRVLATQEQERQRLAAELHDSLGQDLVLVKNLALIEQAGRVNQAPRAPHIAEIAAATDRALGEVHAIAYALRPPELDRLGLAKALAGMVRRTGEASGIQFQTQIEFDGALPAGSDIQLFRIAQEAVNNLVKHSGAKTARVELWQDEGGVHLLVADDGCGLPAAPESSHTGGGLGLAGIEERARLIGARCRWLSQAGQGTTLSLLVAR